MNRNTRVLIVVGVAVLIASLAAFGVYWAIAHQPGPVEDKTSTQAVVATHAIEVGSRVTADDVKLIPWPKEHPVPGMFDDVKKVQDRGALTPIAENEPLTNSKLSQPNDIGFQILIEQGMRAMSVRVNDVIGVAGYVVPGSFVDVLVTIRSDRDSATRVVVSNVRVLTAGTRFDEAKVKEEGKAIQSSVVTLLVSPSDAERIALAQTEGQLMLALRNSRDKAPTITVGAHQAELIGRGPTPPPATPRPPQGGKGGRSPTATTSITTTTTTIPPTVVKTIKAGKAEEIRMEDRTR